jgi:DNA-binding NarL/FixJ family response regulator
MNIPLRILIADDFDVVREGARVLIERQPGWEVCGQAANGVAAVELAEKLEPDIVVLDMTMPELNGLEAARKIKKLLPKCEALMLTGRESDELIREVFESGVKSYILKSQTTEHLVPAIQSLAQHKPYFTSGVAEVLFARMLQKTAPKREDADENDDRLTTREREIVQLLAEGKSNKEVADKLGISLRTAETHRAAIMRKLRVDSLAAIVRYAIRHHIIEA